MKLFCLLAYTESWFPSLWHSVPAFYDSLALFRLFGYRISTDFTVSNSLDSTTPFLSKCSNGTVIGAPSESCSGARRLSISKLSVLSLLKGIEISTWNLRTLNASPNAMRSYFFLFNIYSISLWIYQERKMAEKTLEWSKKTRFWRKECTNQAQSCHKSKGWQGQHKVICIFMS